MFSAKRGWLANLYSFRGRESLSCFRRHPLPLRALSALPLGVLPDNDHVFEAPSSHHNKTNRRKHFPAFFGVRHWLPFSKVLKKRSTSL